MSIIKNLFSQQRGSQTSEYQLRPPVCRGNTVWTALTSGSLIENILDGRNVCSAYEKQSSVLWINVRAQSQAEPPVCLEKNEYVKQILKMIGKLDKII